jgi:FHS family L-fucose permease-like MFS transporter
MRGLGKYSKRGSGFIVAGVSGGAVVPPILFAASDSAGGKTPTATAMAVPMAFFIAAWTYPICVNFVPAYRDVADSFSTTDIGITNVGARDVEKQDGAVAADHGKDGSAAQTESLKIG